MSSTRGLDLLTASRRELDIYWLGHLWGYQAGYDAGWRDADEHAAALHRAAADIVEKVARDILRGAA